MSDPSVFYGEKKAVWVDIPAENCTSESGLPWINLGQFGNRREAIAFIREFIDPNCDDEGRVCLITESM